MRRSGCGQRRVRVLAIGSSWPPRAVTSASMTPRSPPTEQGRDGVALNFVADEPLEAIEQRLRAAGFPPDGTIVDQEWGRSLLVPAPDGTVIQIDEQDRELYT